MGQVYTDEGFALKLSRCVVLIDWSVLLSIGPMMIASGNSTSIHSCFDFNC